MNLAVLSSLVMILAVVYVPFLQTIFGTEALGWAQWAEIIPLLLIPSDRGRGHQGRVWQDDEASVTLI